MSARSVRAIVFGLAMLAIAGVTGADAQQPTAPPAPPPATAPAAKPDTPAAPVALPPEVLEPVTKLARSIETAEKSIQQLKEIEGELSRLRGDVERIIYDSTATAEALRPQLDEVRGQIQKLGPPPAKDKPPESAVIATERERLNQQAAALEGAIKTAELAWVRAKQLIDRITVLRYQQFTRNLFERRDSPLMPGVWRDVTQQMDTILGRARYYGGDWLSWAQRSSTQVLGILAGAFVIFLAGTFGVEWVIRRQLPPLTPSPSFFERVAKGAWVAPLRMLPLTIAAGLVYTGFDYLDLLYSHWARPGEAMLKGLLVYAVSAGLLKTALAPRLASWRLFPVADSTARRVLWILKAFVAVYVVDTVTISVERVLYVPLTVTAAQSFVTTLLFFGLLVGLLLTRIEPLVGPDRPVNGHEFVPGIVTRHTPLWLKAPLWAAALTILFASLLGYISLGRFVAHQLVLTGMVVLAAGLVYLAIRAITRGRGDGTSLIGGVLERHFGLDAPRRLQLSRLTELVATLGLALLALPALLVQWGFSGEDIRDWLKALLFGFEIGQFRISLVRVLIGIGLFTALLFLTRVVQRWLRERVLAQTRMDVGIANSIETAVGYAGTALALLLAVSYSGFDITSLAIVASALAVGVGFGLQSIVNNFVSGLILLVERPIKVGDWIVVGTEQGNVRRISVRSTEIETFDRASLIVPNSELVTGRVLNWTHRNLLGRTILKVTVDASADPEAVLAILRDCAKADPDVLAEPAPFVSFDNFTGSGLEFTVRVTLADVTRSGPVSTNLRIAILKALRAAGIVVPKTQHDVFLRDLDFFKAIVQRTAEQRQATEAARPVAADGSDVPDRKA